MQKEINPVIVWGALGLVVIVVIVIAYRVLGSRGFNPDRTGSEQKIEEFQKTGKFYQPPPQAIPGGGGMGGPPGMGGAPMGMPTGPPSMGGTPGGIPTGPPGGR